MNTRPISPHATIYRWPLNAVMSILFRITGASLMFGSVLVVWWLLAAATSATYFDLVDGLLTSLVGELILIASLFALWYHTCNGIRHLIWDTGYAFASANVKRTAWAAIIAAIVLTAVTLVIIQ